MLAVVALSTWFYFSLFFALSYFKRDISFIDVGWGPAFSWNALVMATWQWSHLGNLQWLVGLLVLAWSSRLAIYLHSRNKSKGEDPRYTELAKNWRGPYWLNAYFRVFMVQAAISLIVALPIILVMNAAPYSLTISSLIGAIVAIGGLVTEAFADAQMSQFQKIKPRPGKFCRLGLWRHSRHPNYFGEIVFWFGLALCGLTVRYGPVCLLGPIFLTFLLLKVSGVPMIENKYKDHPEWPVYAASTRVLVPLPKGKSHD